MFLVFLEKAAFFLKKNNPNTLLLLLDCWFYYASKKNATVLSLNIADRQDTISAFFLDYIFPIPQFHLYRYPGYQ